MTTTPETTSRAQQIAAGAALYREFEAALLPILTEEAAALKKRAQNWQGLTAVIKEADNPPGARSLPDSIATLAKRNALARLRESHPQFFTDQPSDRATDQTTEQTS